MARPKTINRDNIEYRLWSKWQDVWGNWQFWWQYKDHNGVWQNEANGDQEWAERMSNHYKIAITGEYVDESK